MTELAQDESECVRRLGHCLAAEEHQSSAKALAASACGLQASVFAGSVGHAVGGQWVQFGPVGVAGGGLKTELSHTSWAAKGDKGGERRCMAV